MGGMFVRQTVKAGGGLLRWMLPTLRLIGAVVSVLTRQGRIEQHKMSADRGHQNALHGVVRFLAHHQLNIRPTEAGIWEFRIATTCDASDGLRL